MLTDAIGHVPTFVRCSDGKFYEDLVYQDLPIRRAWFICFDAKEPAELVIRHDLAGELTPRTILTARGFDSCVKAFTDGRKDPHLRFFGAERNILTGVEKPVDGHKAVSFFLMFRRGEALPAPTGQDVCTEIYPFFPNKPGVYFGDNR